VHLYLHDQLLQTVLKETNIGTTESWNVRDGYAFPKLSRQLLRLRTVYKIAGPHISRSGTTGRMLCWGFMFVFGG